MLPRGMKGAIALFGYGALAVIIGGLILADQFRFERNSTRTVARVVEHRSHTALNKAGQPYEQLFDVYEFGTDRGETTRFEALVWGLAEPAPIGQTALAFYPPEQPEGARLVGTYSGLGWGAIAFGAVFFGLGGLHLRNTRSVLPRVGSTKNREKRWRQKQRRKKRA